jgi:hypothetical protein
LLDSICYWVNIFCWAIKTIDLTFVGPAFSNFHFGPVSEIQLHTGHGRLRQVETPIQYELMTFTAMFFRSPASALRPRHRSGLRMMKICQSLPDQFPAVPAQLFPALVPAICWAPRHSANLLRVIGPATLLNIQTLETGLTMASGVRLDSAGCCMIIARNRLLKQRSIHCIGCITPLGGNNSVKFMIDYI